MIPLKRDCKATLIPVGTEITIPSATQVVVTQALGGSFTVNVAGNLARIAGEDADALGLEYTLIKKDITDVDGPVDIEQVWEQLRTCYDPEIPVNIVELGLIYECKTTELEDGGNQVNITMTLTAPGCGMGPILVDDAHSKVMSVKNVTEVHCELVFDPPWDQGMMSEAARLQTGLM
ncbi:putative Fe-S cluster assembly protein SufT [Gammaproteobacteria bacterium AH-315-C21]|nr:putative Fe-S cluster assembly protein SufT [Gammaproteobacteria bacterium AH-315-C21]